MKKYLIYGTSILFGRGLELLVLLIASYYLTKEDYGGLEFYKKIIELGAATLTFGLPTLILSYPKSLESKKYFTFISLLFIIALALFTIPFLILTKYIIILIPVFFHSIFFNNGIVPPFLLTYKGSNVASYYKIISSAIFYFTTLAFVVFSYNPEYSFVYVNYILLPFSLIFCLFFLYKNKIVLKKLRRYWNLFKKLIISSLTIVLSNFANMMFLYTDILIIKLLSDNANIEIADYSFSLNIAGALILVPLTMVQVDIEKLKNKTNDVLKLNRKIMFFVLTLSIVLLGIFLILTNVFFQNYKANLLLFIAIIVAKILQAFSILHGAQIIIKKKYSQNLKINLIAVVTNILLSYLFYETLGIMGVAFVSVLTLGLRYFMLIKLNKSLQ